LREVREEFRPLWAQYFASVKAWDDSELFAEVKENLIIDQGTALDERRDEAMFEFRKERGEVYKELLSDQRDDRHTLHERQDAGLDSGDFLNSVEERRFARATERTDEFRDSARENERATGSRSMKGTAEGVSARDPDPEESGARAGADVGMGAALGSALFFASILGSLGDALTRTETRKPTPRQTESDDPRANTRKADDDAAWIASRKREQEEAAYRDRQQERYWE